MMFFINLAGRLTKLRARQMALAARILVANTLLLGCIWYLITIWAGKLSFLTKIQQIIDKFVWSGRSRVARATVALPKAEGGLGLLGVEAQYNALISNLMVWVLMEGDHPLRLILRSHIHHASARRWGTEDLTWAVSTCGTMKLEGSATWLNICKGWATLKKRLLPNKPMNLEEWGDLPLWRPHLNHVDPTRVKCSTIAQKRLQQHGFRYMAHVWEAANGFISWQDALLRGAPDTCEAAFTALISNLKVVPEVAPPPDSMHDLFLHGRENNNELVVWQFRVPAHRISAQGIPILNRPDPDKTFRIIGSHLVTTATRRSDPDTRLHRTLVRAPRHSSHTFFLGPWTRESSFCTQYAWQDGTIVLNSSTPQIRLLQVHGVQTAHGALRKWEVQLGSPISESIWTSTWLSYRSAAENTFLWQLIYRIPATNRWRLLDRIAADPET